MERRSVDPGSLGTVHEHYHDSECDNASPGLVVIGGDSQGTRWRSWWVQGKEIPLGGGGDEEADADSQSRACCGDGQLER